MGAWEELIEGERKGGRGVVEEQTDSKDENGMEHASNHVVGPRER